MFSRLLPNWFTRPKPRVELSFVAAPAREERSAPVAEASRTILKPPAPTLAAPTTPRLDGLRPDTKPDRQRDALREAFTPTRPLVSSDRLAGRGVQFARTMRALREQMAHVALYAERGLGKTSLANLVAEALRADGVVVARFTCAAGSDYGSMMRGLMRDMPRTLLAAPAAGATSREGCEAALPDGPIEPRHVLEIPDRLAGSIARRQIVLMVDEFDRMVDGAAREAVADTLKQVSDRGLPLSFVLVGVSDSLEQLLGYHPSLQRNLVSVPLPLLGAEEMEALVSQGATMAGLVMPPNVRSGIASLSRGVPYIGQLLGLHAGYSAVTRGETTVSGIDLDAAISVAVEEADLRIVGSYEAITAGGRDAAMAVALRAIAAGVQDSYGRFQADASPGNGMLTVAGRQIPIETWERLLQQGIVRACIGVGTGVFTFSEAMLRHYILMRATRDISHTGDPDP